MKTNLLIFALTIAFIGCSKDDNPLKPTLCKINTIRSTDVKARTDILNYSYNNEGELLPTINSNNAYIFWDYLSLDRYFPGFEEIKFDDNGYIKSVTEYSTVYTFDTVKNVFRNDTLKTVYSFQIKDGNIYLKNTKTGLEMFEYYTDKANQILYPYNVKYGKPSKNLLKRNGNNIYNYNFNDNGCISKVFCNSTNGYSSKSFEVTYE